MHPEIAEKREELAQICQRHGVERIEVFGSAAHGTDFDLQSSDVDFLVEFRRAGGGATLRQYFGFREPLCEALGRPVDLVQPAAIRNPYLQAAIDRSRELIYAS